MEFELKTNLNEVIEDWDKLREDLRKTIIAAVNEATRRGVITAQTLAEERLYNPDGYNASFTREMAEERNNEIVGKIINYHQWAEAIEGGTPAHEGGPEGFRVSPERPPYPWFLKPDKRGWRTFYYHKGARAFNIFRDTRNILERVLPRLLREWIERITR
jgi:hypothetical protein